MSNSLDLLYFISRPAAPNLFVPAKRSKRVYFFPRIDFVFHSYKFPFITSAVVLLYCCPNLYVDLVYIPVCILCIITHVNHTLRGERKCIKSVYLIKFRILYIKTLAELTTRKKCLIYFIFN